MKSKTYQIILTPDQRAALDQAIKDSEHATLAALITAALTAYLAALKQPPYPPTPARGGNQRKAKRETLAESYHGREE